MGCFYLNRTFSSLVLLFLFSIPHFLQAQNLDQIGSGKALRISGGVSSSQIFYGIRGMESRRDPFTFFASGNLNFDLYGLSIPLSFSYSNQNTSFQQPFNQYGISPRYKALTLHAGYRSMSFSSYTLSGHLFLGGGFEVNGKSPFKVSAMYGRLRKAVEFDSIQGVEPVFARFGCGLKTTYQKGANALEFIVFGAQDRENSLNFVPLDSKINPQENLVLSLVGRKSIGKRVSLSTEYANSAITRDLRSAEYEAESSPIYDYFKPIFKRKTSTNYYNALKAGLNYAGDFYTLGLAYERVEPGYETLGAYFFNNDLENYTLNTSLSLFDQKFSISANAGLQRNNLENEGLSSMTRWVGSTNINYAASEKWQINGAYSNFQTFTRIRSVFEDINQLSPYENLDTLNFTQISQSASLGGNYLLGSSKEARQSINLNISYQQAKDQQGGIEQNSGSCFYNFNTSYSLSVAPQNLTVTGALNYNRSQTIGTNHTTFGPIVSVNKSFFDKKLRGAFSTSYNQSSSGHGSKSRTLNLRANAAYTLYKKHNLNLGLVVLNKGAQATSAKPFTEFTGTLSYGFNF